MAVRIDGRPLPDRSADRQQMFCSQYDFLQVGQSHRGAFSSRFGDDIGRRFFDPLAGADCTLRRLLLQEAIKAAFADRYNDPFQIISRVCSAESLFDFS